MTSKEDDTLPLPGYSQELSIDTTVDEDFIPASQPQSSGSLKVPVTSFSKSTKELKCATSDSNIDETFPVTDMSSVDWDKSADFIPETETKKTKINFVTDDYSCKKKLSVFDPQDIFKVQSNPTKWDSDISKIPESPALDSQNFSILNDSPIKIPLSNQEAVKKCEDSITEIIVNDSSETVDLETTPVKTEDTEAVSVVEKLEISCSLNSDVERCEETQIFDNSVLLDQAGTGSLVLETNEISGMTPEKLYLQQTIDDNELNLQENANNFNLRCDSFPIVAELSGKSDVTEDAVDMPRSNESSLDKKVAVKSNSMEQSKGSTAVRKIDFKLTVNCIVFINTKTNKVVKKIISNVFETPKSKTKSEFVDHASDNASDKSKRYSTSSSGSVYSDNTGLPFALPKRVSAISDLTDSSEDDFGSLPKKERRALERVPWKNEYLLPLKMDDIMQISIEKEDFLKRPIIASPRKPKKHCDGVNNLKEILESSSSERTSLPNSGSGESEVIKTSNFEEVLGKEALENSETLLLNEVKKPDDKLDKCIENEPEREVESDNGPVGDGKKEKETAELDVYSKQTYSSLEKNEIEEESRLEEESTLASLREGLPVFARWSDKRYYPGILTGTVKNNRWDVKFDDGTLKAVRENFIMPSEWLKLGALVFVLTDDRYESGQIVDVKEGEELRYSVELDAEKKIVSVKISDLCLTDVMAGIVREKYKPLIGTPRGTADIDFDNVVSGKRLREQRTPLKPATAQSENTEAKKNLSKGKKTNRSSLEFIEETPSTKDSGQIGGLKAESGHLIEDKFISTGSQSGNEAGETPLRGTPKERKGKAKPRSLSYEAEEICSKKKISKSWVAPDGTPIPGPSGVRFRKQKTKTREPEIAGAKGTGSPAVVTRSSSKKNDGRPKASISTEKSKRKRKLDESGEDSIKKKSLKKDGRIKSRIKKG